MDVFGYGETSMATSSVSFLAPPSSLLHVGGPQGSGLFSVYALLSRPLAAFYISLLTFIGFQTCIYPTVSSAYALGCGGRVLKRSQTEHV